MSAANIAVQFGCGEDRLGNVETDLALVDVDAEHELDIGRAVAADGFVDQPRWALFGAP